MLLGVALVATRGAGINIGRGPLVEFITRNIDLGFIRLPMPLIITLLVYLISWVILRHTKLGRYTYAMGGNETATRLSGINVNLYKTFIYGISGLFSAIAGVLVMARLQSGAYQNGTNMTLISVAAVVIGGTALSGGVGGIWGTLVGVFILRIVEQGLVYMNVPSNAKEIVIGAIIVLAVALDVIRRGDVKWLRFSRRARA
jgi:ribose transport system permease protein